MSFVRRHTKTLAQIAGVLMILGMLILLAGFVTAEVLLTR
ncbi:exported hypothetical protein [Nitrolancea hollandica Lb]|uniref:Uncharacterized protein n=1 Tax=Nitrolancea hollandica Lb TaxID=1129897 RepID=I4ECB6_9BACT|nr:exported hypothetical protein [Nitrolancea hollandica Lb]